MIILGLSLLVSLMSGFFMAWIFLPQEKPTIWQVLFRLSLAPALGLGISFLVSFLVLIFCGPSAVIIMTADVAVLVVLAAAFAWIILKQSEALSVPAPEAVRRPLAVRWVLGLGFAALLIAAAVNFAVMTAGQPNGHSDAKMSWNMRAKYLMRLDATHWKQAFAPDSETKLFGYQSDYPPFLSMAVMRSWKWSAAEDPLAPALIAALLTFGAVGVLVCALRLLSDSTTACIAGIALLGAPNFIWRGTAQTADIPLGCFYIAAVALLALHGRFSRGGFGTAALAGFVCGIACLTKYDGTVFPVALSAAWIWTCLKRVERGSRGRALAGFFATLIPLLALTAYYRTCLVTATSVQVHQSASELLGRSIDLSRIGTIVKMSLSEMLSVEHWGGLPFVLPFLGLLLGFRVAADNRRSAFVAVAAVTLTFVCYFGYFLVMEPALEWRLTSTVDRLPLHFWPMAVFAFFLLVRSPEEAIVQGPEPKDPATP